MKTLGFTFCIGILLITCSLSAQPSACGVWQNTQKTLSTLDIIESKIDDIEGCSLSEEIYDNTEIIKSKIFVQNTEIEIIDSKIDDLDDTLKNIEEIEQIEAHCPTVITQSDIPLNISSPGYFVMCNDIDLGSLSGSAAITISSSYVTLDMNQKALYQSAPGANVTDIQVVAGMHDITIKNGTIASFTNYGVEVQNNTHHVTIENMHVSGNNVSSTSGIALLGTAGNVVHDCTISNCLISEIIDATDCFLLQRCNNVYVENVSCCNNTGASAAQTNFISLTNANACQLRNCHVDNNSGQTGNEIRGILCNNSNNLIIESCTVQKNTGNNTGLVALIGINMQNTDASEIIACDISKNGAANGDLYTLVINNSTGNTIDECVFTDNNASVDILYGIFENGGNGNIIKNCTINRNSAGNIAGGIYSTTSTSTIIQNCHTHATNGGTTGTGIRFFTGTAPQIIDCTSSYNSNVGINVDVNSVNPIVSGCSVYNNTFFGIHNSSSTASIVNCTASGNAIDNFGGTYPGKPIEPKGNIEYGYSGPGEMAFDKKDGIIYIPASAIVGTGLSITKPGHYKLTENVSFDGAAASTTISIEADYVSLDLNGFAIENTNTNDATALSIATGQHDIEIKNGTISGFAGDSILINTTCYNIALTDLSLVGRAPTTASTHAIHLAGTSTSNDVRNIVIQHCDLTKFYAPDSSGVLQMTNSYEVEVTDCTFNDNGLSGSVSNQNVILLTDCANCTFSHCQCNGNVGYTLQKILQLDTCSSILVEQCEFNHNTIDEQGSILLIDTCQGVTVRQCNLNGNSFSAIDTSPSACIYVNGGSGCEIDSCTILSNNGTGIGTLAGILLIGPTATYVYNSLIQDLTATSTSPRWTFGIGSFGTTKSKIMNTTTININNTNVAAQASGIYFGLGTSNMVQNCSVLGCSGTGLENNEGTSGFWGNEAIQNGTNFAGAAAPTGTLLTLTGDNSPIYKYQNVRA